MYFPVLLSIVKQFNMFNESLMNEHTLIILKSELEKLNLDPRSLQYRRVQNICRGKIIIMAHKFMIYKSCFLLSAGYWGHSRTRRTSPACSSVSQTLKWILRPSAKCGEYIFYYLSMSMLKASVQYLNMYLSLSYLSFMSFISRLSFNII